MSMQKAEHIIALISALRSRVEFVQLCVMIAQELNYATHSIFQHECILICLCTAF